MVIRKDKQFLIPIKVLPDGKNGMCGGGFTMAFVYAPRGNFLIKGYYREVKKYIDETFKQGFVNYTLWYVCDYTNKKTHRSIWSFIGDKLSIHEPYRPKRGSKTHKWGIYPYSKKDVVMRLKRMPKCWIPEFSELDK